MKKIEGPLKKVAQDVGRHESGHFVVAKVLGFKTGCIGMIITDIQGGHKGEAEIELASKLDDIESVEKYLKDRIIVLYAGALSESLNLGKIDNERALDIIRNGGGSNDHAKAKELIHLLRSIRAPDISDPKEIQAGLDSIDAECWKNAAELVEAESVIIDWLGSRIASEVKLIGINYKLEGREIESLPEIKKRFS